MAEKIPGWLRPYFKAADLSHIQSLVREIESQTAVELVPLIVRTSIDLSLWRLFLTTFAGCLTLLLAPPIYRQLGWESTIAIEIIYFSLFLGFGLIAWFLSTFQPFLRLFFGALYLEQTVWKRACSEFFSNQLHQSQSRSAVLFMYSVVERKAMIIPDPSLVGLDPELWQQAIKKMVVAAKQKNFYQGFDEALHFVAAQLARQFPATPNNINELPDQVIIKN